MSTKHTQGNWAVDNFPFLQVCSEGQSICQLSDIKMNKSINIMSDEWDSESLRAAGEKIANAKLIAAAPELLEMVEYFRLCAEKDFYHTDAKYWANQCQKLINKATI